MNRGAAGEGWRNSRLVNQSNRRAVGGRGAAVHTSLSSDEWHDGMLHERAEEGEEHRLGWRDAGWGGQAFPLRWRGSESQAGGGRLGRRMNGLNVE